LEIQLAISVYTKRHITA